MSEQQGCPTRKAHKMISIVTFMITLFAGLISTAEYVHSGQANAGATKKAWVLAQMQALLAGPTPIITGVSPIIVSASMTVLRYVLPVFGGPAVDFIVSKLNANSFFSSIESFLNEALSSLTSGTTTTPTPAA